MNLWLDVNCMGPSTSKAVECAPPCDLGLPSLGRSPEPDERLPRRIEPGERARVPGLAQRRTEGRVEGSVGGSALSALGVPLPVNRPLSAGPGSTRVARRLPKRHRAKC